ncbi:hypothetical protein [Nonomuraea typhae]|uniref:hypothetical protein n=1 Tax=Nonomuraea typhae TaxID=2603600 RepID=UPI0012F9FDFE|nr:hypothetical protein [Nonomuraea typhae]
MSGKNFNLESTLGDTAGLMDDLLRDELDSPPIVPAQPSAQAPAGQTVVLSLPGGDLTAAPMFTEATSTDPAERLSHYEAIIDGAQEAVERGGQMLRRYLSLAAGQALYRIHSDRLVTNFEEHAKLRWGWSRQHAYRVMYVGLCCATWPDLQVDWTTKQALVLGPLIREHGGDLARAVWDKAVELDDISERGLRTARAMVGLGADGAKELPANGGGAATASPATVRLLSRFEGALAGPEKEFDLSRKTRLREMRDLAKEHPEGAARLVLRMRGLAARLQEAEHELASDVGEELIEEIAARLKDQKS